MPTLTGTIVDVTGSAVPLSEIKRVTIKAPAERRSLHSSNGIVTTREVPVEVSGLLTASLEPGPALLVIIGSSTWTYKMMVTYDMTTFSQAIAEATNGGGAESPEMGQLLGLVQAAEDAATRAETAADEAGAILDNPMTVAEATAGSSTDARTIAPDVLKGAIQRWVTGGFTRAVTTTGQNLMAAASGAAARSAIGAVGNEDPRLSDSRTPTSHNHAVGDITATGTPGATTYLAGDGSWKTPPNTTYSSMSQAEATAGTATTARVLTAAVLKAAVEEHAPDTGGGAPAEHTHTTDEIEHVIDGGGLPLNVLFDAVLSSVEALQTTIQEDSGEWVKTVDLSTLGGGTGLIEFAIRRVGDQVTVTITGAGLSASTPASASISLVQGFEPTPAQYAIPVSGVDGETGDTVLVAALVSNPQVIVQVAGELAFLGGSITFSTADPRPQAVNLTSAGFTQRS